jgi:hypothetical protein
MSGVPGSADQRAELQQLKQVSFPTGKRCERTGSKSEAVAPVLSVHRHPRDLAAFIEMPLQRQDAGQLAIDRPREARLRAHGLRARA